jgi:DnaJ-class molecular chaperone
LKNYYEILGTDKSASQEEIKKAYRNLSKKFHPDVNQDGEARFKEIAEAYEVLGDPAKRAQYDNPRPNPQFDPFTAFHDFSFDMRDTSHLNIQVERRFNLAELMAGLEFTIDYRISKSGLSTSGFENKSVKVKIDLSKSEYPFTKIGNHDAIVLRVRGGGSSMVFERNDFFGRPTQTSSTGDLIIRVLVDMMGLTMNGPDLVQRVDVSLQQILFFDEIILENPLGKKYKITSIVAGNLSDIRVKVQGQGLMSQNGNRGAYLFELKVAKPDITKLSEEESNALSKILTAMG